MNDFKPKRPVSGLLALSPLAVFLGLYLVTSLIAGDFYKVPITVAFLASSVYAILVTGRGEPLAERIRGFSEGASHPNIMLMIWIFVLAGAFARSAEAMGAIEATVNLTLNILPERMLLPGLFLAACFISLSVGTSVGTIVALTPVAAGIAAKAGLDLPFVVAIVVGGSFFGDNLSFISDTTIAATRTQECDMRDKFRVNSLIVIPAAVLVLGFYLFEGFSMPVSVEKVPVEWVNMLPYLIVLGMAVSGIHVVTVLVAGILSTGVIGLATGHAGFFGWIGAIGQGITGMGELIIITLLAGGMLETIRRGGGIDYIIAGLTSRISGRRTAELAIAALVGMANLCTANNTIAIITVGPIARDIADRFGVDRRKSASLLDSFSCFVQGIIPYGAQMLMAASLAALPPLQILEYLYYPVVMGVCSLLAILLRYPRKYS